MSSAPAAASTTAPPSTTAASSVTRFDFADPADLKAAKHARTTAKYRIVAIISALITLGPAAAGLALARKTFVAKGGLVSAAPLYIVTYVSIHATSLE